MTTARARAADLQTVRSAPGRGLPTQENVMPRPVIHVYHASYVVNDDCILLNYADLTKPAANIVVILRNSVEPFDGSNPHWRLTPSLARPPLRWRNGRTCGTDAASAGPDPWRPRSGSATRTRRQGAPAAAPPSGPCTAASATSSAGPSS